MPNITITLLTSKRTRQTIDALDYVVGAQAGGYVVVEGEDNATEIQVSYPDSYAGQNLYVYMKNAKGEYITHYFDNLSQQTTQSFTLPAEMCYRGNTILVFFAAEPNKTTAWLPVIIPVAATSLDYHEVAKASEDFLRQVLEEAQEAQEICQQIAAAAERGDFDGKDGEDGLNVFIRYSAYADGHSMTEHWQRGQRYIGTIVSEVASDDYTDYEWLQFVGESYCDESSASGAVSLILADGSDRTLTSTVITSLTITVPSGAGTHGFYSGLNFKSGSTAPTVSFTNSSGKPLKIIVNGEVKASYSPTAGKTTQAVIYGDGINVYAYINEV